MQWFHRQLKESALTATEAADFLIRIAWALDMVGYDDVSQVRELAAQLYESQAEADKQVHLAQVDHDQFEGFWRTRLGA